MCVCVRVCVRESWCVHGLLCWSNESAGAFHLLPQGDLSTVIRLLTPTILTTAADPAHSLSLAYKSLHVTKVRTLYEPLQVYSRHAECHFLNSYACQIKRETT